MKKTCELALTFRDLIPIIEIGQCYQNALLVADIYPEVQYVEGLAFNGERWLAHAWNCLDAEEFDLTFQIHFPHLLYCDGYARRRHRTFFGRPHKIALLPSYIIPCLRAL
ncbi:hypothetical protein [Nostoc sp.]